MLCNQARITIGGGQSHVNMAHRFRQCDFSRVFIFASQQHERRIYSNDMLHTANTNISFMLMYAPRLYNFTYFQHKKLETIFLLLKQHFLTQNFYHTFFLQRKKNLQFVDTFTLFNIQILSILIIMLNFMFLCNSKCNLFI